MPGASEDLLGAVYGLRKAAEADFTGNAYYQVTNRIDGLIEHLGWGDGGIRAGKGAAYGFASMLAEARRIAEASTSGNQYHMIARELDQLGSYLTPSATAAPKAEAMSEKRIAAIAANAPVAAPAPAPVSISWGARPTFDALAAASKARVEEMAASFGIATAHHPDTLHHETPHHEAEPILADGELERRSSEPCSMEELAPVILEPVAAAAFSAEAAAVSQLDGGAHHLGSPSAPAGDGATQGTAAAQAPETAPHPAAEPSAPAHDRAADAAREKIESFDDLAAASKAQVEHMAAALGVHELPPVDTERRLESRSSEAVTQSLETLEPAAIPGEIAAEPHPAEAALHLGSPAAEGEPAVVEEAVFVEIATVEIAAEQAPASAAVPMGDAQAVPPGQEKAGEELKPKKTLFRLWLDLAFGRKD
ncbi:MAG: hypothetical protein WCD20_05490 [Rhodomicrobium sp.]